MFWWMKNTMELVKSLRITKDAKIQIGRQLWLKKVVLGNGPAVKNPNLELYFTPLHT